jgi:hypothetical protein
MSCTFTPSLPLLTCIPFPLFLPETPSILPSLSFTMRRKHGPASQTPAAIALPPSPMGVPRSGPPTPRTPAPGPKQPPSTPRSPYPRSRAGDGYFAGVKTDLPVSNMINKLSGQPDSYDKKYVLSVVCMQILSDNIAGTRIRSPRHSVLGLTALSDWLPRMATSTLSRLYSRRASREMNRWCMTSSKCFRK